MVKMPNELINLLKEWHTIPVATVGKDGKPNVAGKSVMVKDDETIIWGELYFMQTYENLKQTPIASLCVWRRSPPFKAYKINGRVEVHENDELALQMDTLFHHDHETMGFPKHGHGTLKNHPVYSPRREKMSVVVFRVEEIYDQTPSLEAGGKSIS